MTPVPKKVMLPFTLQNSRGVLCASVAGKVVAKGGHLGEAARLRLAAALNTDSSGAGTGGSRPSEMTKAEGPFGRVDTERRCVSRSALVASLEWVLWSRPCRVQPPWTSLR